MSGKVLLIVKSADCGHCMNFEQNYQNSLQDALRQEFPGIAQVIITKNSMRSPIPNGYPGALNKIRFFYPSFLLLSQREWEEAARNPSYMFSDINYMNATVSVQDGMVIPTYKNQYQVNTEGIMKWIRDNVSKKEEAPPPSRKKSIGAVPTPKKNETCGSIPVYRNTRKGRN